MKSLLLIFLSLSIASVGNAGPFGLQMGTPLANLKILEKSSDEVYRISVPQPSGIFESYSVYVTRQDGLCKVLATGFTLENDSQGYEAKEKYERLKESLTAKYGKSKSFDFLSYDSIWKDPNDWAMAVKVNDRSLSSFWDRQEGSSLPEDILSINLSAKSLGRSNTYISLSYEFSNFKTCLGRRNAKDESVL